MAPDRVLVVVDEENIRLTLDPTFAPARANLAASVDPFWHTGFLLGESKPEPTAKRRP